MVQDEIKEKNGTEFFGFNYDKIFKAIFVGTEKHKKDLLCALIGECIKEKIYNIDFIPIELNARRENERYKRLDVLAEADGKKINVELNSSYDEAGRVRNLNYYFSFCSQYTKTGKEYDTKSEFIHISLNYGVSLKEPLVKCFMLYDKENDCILDDRFKYYEINVEKFAKLWYDKDMKIVRENPLLTMIGIKNKEDLEEYSKEMNISNIRESVAELKRLNSNKTFVYDISPEQEEIMMKNTIKNLAREEGEAIGETRGIATATLNIATNLLKQNMPIEQISLATGLSIEELNKIDITDNK